MSTYTYGNGQFPTFDAFNEEFEEDYIIFKRPKGIDEMTYEPYEWDVSTRHGTLEKAKKECKERIKSEGNAPRKGGGKGYEFVIIKKAVQLTIIPV